MPRSYTFTPNYGDWPLDSVLDGETEDVQARLSPQLVEDLKSFARLFQETYDYETGEFAAGSSRTDFRDRYQSLAQRIRAEGISVELDYWWDKGTA